MTQNAYKLYPDAGTVGQLASTGIPSRVRAVTNGSTPLPFGRMCSYDSSGNLALGGTARFAGVTLDSSYIPGATGDLYPADVQVPVTDINDVFVTNTAGTAVAGGTVYVNTATGEFRASTAASNVIALDGATFVTGGAADNLVIVSLTAPANAA